MTDLRTQTDLAPDTRPRDWMKRSTIEGFAALIVGGGSGMGASAAQTFAANGGVVAVADLRFVNAQKVAAGIVESGGKAIAIALDVSKPEDSEAGVKATVEAFGRLDVLINSATWS